MAHFPFFRFEGNDKQPIPVVGLFMAWRVTPINADTDEYQAPSKPEFEGGEGTEFRLGFTGAEGRLFPVVAGLNPWALVAFSELGPKGNARKQDVEEAQQFPPLQLSDAEIDVLLIAHPSAEFAREVVARLNAGKGPDGAAGKFDDWRPLFRRLKPRKVRGSHIFELPTASDAYFPRGPAALEGWCLYRFMPHQPLNSAKKATGELSKLLGSLGYPTASFDEVAPTDPYAEKVSHASFSPVVQAAVHHFQARVESGEARVITASGQAAPDPTWRRALTEPATSVSRLTATRAPGERGEVGFVDSALFQTMSAWQDNGLLQPGQVMVRFEWPPRSTKAHSFWAQPELIVALLAWSETCLALGSLYPLFLSNTMRAWSASGGGQVKASHHKIGRALDLETGVMYEPSSHMPVAFEAGYSGERPRWQLYVHASPGAHEALEARLREARDKVAAELTRYLGEAVKDANTWTARMGTLHRHLLTLSPEQLNAQFYRTSVRRFQPQAGQRDGGDVMEPTTAAQDKTRNGYPFGGTPTRWLNASRVAWHLGLHSMGANRTGASNEDLSYVPSEAPRNEKPKPDPWEWVGPMTTSEGLDRLAEGIRLARELGGGTHGIHVLRPDQESLVKKGDAERTAGTGSVNRFHFDLDTIQFWLRRLSDGDLPGLMSGLVERRSKQGLDLVVTWHREPVRQSERDRVDGYLAQRANVHAEILHVGEALRESRLRPQSIDTLANIGQALFLVTPSQGGSPDNTLILRPRFFVPQTNDDFASLRTFDPGQLRFRVVRTITPKALEWWHYELSAQGKQWTDLADDLGLSRSSLQRPEASARDSGAPWLPGWGVADKAYPPKDGPEPDNSPGSPLSPDQR